MSFEFATATRIVFRNSKLAGLKEMARPLSDAGHWSCPARGLPAPDVKYRS